MAKHKHSQGYILAGILFLLALVCVLVKGDIFLNHTLSKDDALPVRAVKIDGVFRQLSKKKIADVTGRVCAGQNIANLDLNVLKEELYNAMIADDKYEMDNIRNERNLLNKYINFIKKYS